MRFLSWPKWVELRQRVQAIASCCKNLLTLTFVVKIERKLNTKRLVSQPIWLSKKCQAFDGKTYLNTFRSPWSQLLQPNSSLHFPALYKSTKSCKYNFPAQQSRDCLFLKCVTLGAANLPSSKRNRHRKFMATPGMEFNLLTQSRAANARRKLINIVSKAESLIIS